MSKKLLIAVGENTKNFIQKVKTEADKLCLPIENYDIGEIDSYTIGTGSVFEMNGDVWAGMDLFETQKKYFCSQTKDYDKIIVITKDFSETFKGFIYCFAKYLKRKHKKLTLILNGRCLSRYFLADMRKYCTIVDVYASKEYQNYYKQYFPKISILSLDGLLNTIYLRELKKCA